MGASPSKIKEAAIDAGARPIGAVNTDVPAPSPTISPALLRYQERRTRFNRPERRFEPAVRNNNTSSDQGTRMAGQVIGVTPAQSAPAPAPAPTGATSRHWKKGVGWVETA